MRNSVYDKIYQLVEKSFDKTMENHIKLCEKSKQLENRNDKSFQTSILMLQFDIEYIELKLYRWFFKNSVERIKRGEKQVKEYEV